MRLDDLLDAEQDLAEELLLLEGTFSFDGRGRVNGGKRAKYRVEAERGGKRKISIRARYF